MLSKRIAARRLDGNHLGAGVGEEHRGERPGEALAEVDDGDPVAGLPHSAGMVRESPPPRYRTQ